MIIITKNKAYKWNPRQLLKNLGITALILGFLLLYGIVGKMDYLTLVR